MVSIAPEVESAWESLKSENIKRSAFIPEKTDIVKDAEGNGDWSEFLSNFGRRCSSF